MRGRGYTQTVTDCLMCAGTYLFARLGLHLVAELGKRYLPHTADLEKLRIRRRVHELHDVLLLNLGLIHIQLHGQ
jgi:hypothetical protein